MLEWELSNRAAVAGLVDRLKRHEPKAMEDLYDRYAVLVYSLARRIVGDGGEAEDIVLEIFLRVWNRAHLLDFSKGFLTSWLLIATRNIAIDVLRAKRGKGPSDLTVEMMARLLNTESAYQNLFHVGRALENLEPNQRIVIELAYFEGLSESEMAQQMNCPLETIKTWVRTALCSLRGATHSVVTPPS